MSVLSNLRIECDPRGTGFSFAFVTRKLVGSPTRIPVSEWTAHAPDHQVAAIATLLAWVEDERAHISSDETVEVPHQTVASLDSVTCRLLRLPPACPFVLDVQHLGTLDRPEFKFRCTWLRPSGQPVPGLRRIGAALFEGSKTYRIPSPLYEIFVATEEFNAAPPEDMDGRFRTWARIRSLFPDEAQRSIHIDGYLGSTRVAHAASFSLTLSSGDGGFTFAPILFGPQMSAGDSPDVTQDVYHEVDALLPPAQHEEFATRRFPAAADCRSHYALNGGWYVVLDEPVQKALTVVRKAQRADAQTRREFVRNPRSFLEKALGEQLAKDVLETAFVETAEYSARIRDVGLWQPRVLPWVKRGGEKWLPESFGVRVGEKTVSLEPKELPHLTEEVEHAIEAGQPTVEWNGHTIPATASTLASLMALTGEVAPPEKGEEEPAADGLSEGKAGPYRPSSPLVLEIQDNLSEIGFNRLRVPRPNVPPEHIPVQLKSILKEHQREGLSWLQGAWASGMPGVLLADDMGLGKTLQALVFLAWLREAMEGRLLKRLPLLIVAPTGLLKNWEQEHETHLRLPGLGNVLRAYGAGLARIRAQRGREIDIGQATLDMQQLQAADWILTTYETLRDYQHSFCAVRYGCVVFDEMQKIKTPGTVMTHAAKAVNADFAIGLTGTPIENRLADLWCLVDTLEPGLLGDLSGFSKKYERDASGDDLRNLKETLTSSQSNPPVMVRRMKADRLEGLPEKVEHKLPITMPALQAEAYEGAVRAARQSGGGSKILESLHQLRSISLHPFLPQDLNDDEYVQRSARLKAALEVLDSIAQKREKALIFLESQELQPYLAALLQRRYKLRSPPMRINGAVSGPKRQERVNQFQGGAPGFDVMIVSPRAGGVGLTLTAANHVIHLSRWWNPAVEDQCTDRVYRIGQARPVHVYYPQALHPEYGEQSFDARLHSLLDRKRRLSREMLMPPLSPDDATELFEQTVGASDASVNLEAIDSMEPIEFEDWILNGLKAAGHKVSRTPKTHDGGADGIMHHRVSGRPYILQCKHTQGSTSPDKAIDDLLRAKGLYSFKDPGLIAVTNAKGFGHAARSSAAAAGIHLIARDRLQQWPHVFG